MGFFEGKECVGAPQQPLGFAAALSMWDHVGCLYCVYNLCYFSLYTLLFPCLLITL